ncbi:hypothetical protein [Actinomadura geliboluensis]|uniref:hypothetical protein n=1 Tax=Actinomadura geliboluensis TaxID=882440 RepID=UPI003720517C
MAGHDGLSAVGEVAGGGDSAAAEAELHFPQIQDGAGLVAADEQVAVGIVDERIVRWSVLLWNGRGEPGAGERPGW